MMIPEVEDNNNMDTLQLCFELRQAGYKPNRIMNTGKGRVELISYPFPEDGGVFIMARLEIGNPESMTRFELLPHGAWS